MNTDQEFHFLLRQDTNKMAQKQRVLRIEYFIFAVGCNIKRNAKIYY